MVSVLGRAKKSIQILKSEAKNIISGNLVATYLSISDTRNGRSRDVVWIQKAKCFFRELRSLSPVSWCGFVEGRFEFGNDAQEFGEVGNLSEEHRTEHFLVVVAPVGQMGFGRQQAERAWLVRRIIHPRIAKENLPMFGDALENTPEFRTVAAR